MLKLTVYPDSCDHPIPSEPVDPSDAAFDAEEIRKIKDLPKEVGAMLVSVGVLGMILPGVVGTPAIIAGGLVLWPKAFGKLEDWFQRRYPKTHHRSMKQIGRYLDDLERRFPDLSNK
jgi:hypothetical protein